MDDEIPASRETEVWYNDSHFHTIYPFDSDMSNVYRARHAWIVGVFIKSKQVRFFLVDDGKSAT